MRQLLLQLSPPAPPDFDNYVSGENSAAISALQHWLQDKHHPGVSFHLCGERGSGKSHLLKATATYGCRLLDPLTTAQFGSSSDIGDSVLVLAVDHIEHLDNDWQEKLFTAFNHLQASGGKLITAAEQPPSQLELREDLRTRLASGLTFRLHLLSDEDKKIVLRQQCRERAMHLPSGALDYLLTHYTRDMRSLEAIVDALDRYTLETKRTLTMPMLRNALNDFSSPESHA